MSIRTTVIALCLLCGTCILTRAQEPHRQKHSINFGLRSPQPEETLPKGKGEVSIPQIKEKTAAVAGCSRPAKSYPNINKKANLNHHDYKKNVMGESSHFTEI